MRILHLILTADPRYGGPVDAALNIAKELTSHNVSIDLATLDPPSSGYLPLYPGNIFALGRGGGRGLRSWYGYSPRFTHWLRQNVENYDLVIVSGLWRYLNRAARQVLVNGPTPYFVFTHGMLDPWFRRRYPLKHLGKQLSWWLAEGPLLAGARNVLFTCEEEMRQAERAFWPYLVNGHVVSYGSADVPEGAERQIAAFRAAVPEIEDRRHLLFLSRIHEKKGCDLLVAAFAGIAQREPDLDLVIAGPDQVGLVSSLKEQARALGVEQRVHFPGMLTGDAKYGAFRSAEAFTLTSHQENFGIVVAEALACSTPVLISNKVNIWREIVEDQAGLVEPDTAAGSATLLERFVDLSAQEKAALRTNARRSFEQRYRMEDAARNLLSLMEERIAGF